MRYHQDLQICATGKNHLNHENNHLKLVRLGIEARNEFIIYMHADCFVCKSEGFEASSRILVTLGSKSIIATLDIVHTDIIHPCEASLSESAWDHLGAEEGNLVSLSHVKPTTSLKHVRAKIHGNELKAEQFDEIIRDIVLGRYSNIQIASFITACATDELNINEIVYLTQAMIKVGEQLHWDHHSCVMDKHSVGGIPGNRTTPIVVAIVAESGLIIPKTSSRSITSPAGTADTVETMTTVDLSIAKMQQVVAQEGGCLVWGGAIGLSPADDIIIRVERSLDLDPTGQMIASVLSKKAAVGTTHVVIDIPVGATAKIRSDQEFDKLREYFELVGRAVGLELRAMKTDGTQPLGKGIGPALEAVDILAVLNNKSDAPPDLKEKAILFAGAILELGGKAPQGQGQAMARAVLESGAAYKKFMAICEAQGGFKQPPVAAYTHAIVAGHAGTVVAIDNRNLAMVAKLAGAPHDPAAGIEFFARRGKRVDKGQLLYRIHAETKGALHYSLQYARQIPNIVKISRDDE
ncbi:thymidine phosphorylase family protein [Aquicella siphonis]|nr:thymidine phosphorylase family protein [Aquicella siphonis]